MTDGILYRFLDADDSLLYVGITDTFAARLVAHEATKPWFEEVATIAIERHPTRTALAEAEVAAVRLGQPRYNLVRFDGPTRLRSFRIPEEMYRAAQERAAGGGESMTSVIIAALQEYVDDPVS